MSTATIDAEMYLRGIHTLVTSWEAVASGTADSEVQRLDGVTTAVFPTGQERDFLNNAVLAEGMSRAPCSCAPCCHRQGMSPGRESPAPPSGASRRLPERRAPRLSRWWSSWSPFCSLPPGTGSTASSSMSSSAPRA